MRFEDEYKINLHAHSIFSDGVNSPYVMALKAKELGFSALVLTDHVYGVDLYNYGMTQHKMVTYRKAIEEARQVLPVIVGCEVPYKKEEVLVFGDSAVSEVWSKSKLESITDLKSRHDCAVILCHPNINYEEFIDELDGYERYNGGNDYFKRRTSDIIHTIPYYSNSDAHRAVDLDEGWNCISQNITNSDELVKYIKSYLEPKCYIKDKMNS